MNITSGDLIRIGSGIKKMADWVNITFYDGVFTVKVGNGKGVIFDEYGEARDPRLLVAYRKAINNLQKNL